MESLCRPVIIIVLSCFPVLGELDGLKIRNDRARECIRWLDRTISNGSLYLRTQEVKEKLPIVDFVKPRQGARKYFSGCLLGFNVVIALISLSLPL